MTLMGQPNKANPGTKMKQGQKPAGLVLPDPFLLHTPPPHRLSLVGSGGGEK